MINLPREYQISNEGKRLNLKNFTGSAELTASEKKRLRNCLKKVSLTHQIIGEVIPSFMNEDYNCQALLFLKVELDAIKDAPFAAKVIQPLMKPYSVLHIIDACGLQALSFAHKRLKRNDITSIIVEDHYCSRIFDNVEDVEELAFDRLINQNNKRDMYLEAMAKCYLNDNPKIFLGAKNLWESSVWYRGNDSLELFRKMLHVEKLKKNKNKVQTQSEKLDLNNQIKVAIKCLKKTCLI